MAYRNRLICLISPETRFLGIFFYDFWYLSFKKEISMDVSCVTHFQNILVQFFNPYVLIKPVSPQAAQLCVHKTKFFTAFHWDALPWGTWLRILYDLLRWKRQKGKREKAQCPAGIEPMTSQPWGKCATAALHPRPILCCTYNESSQLFYHIQ